MGENQTDLPPPDAILALHDWHAERGSLMFRKKAHELTADERKMMRTPPEGWRYCIDAAAWVYSPSER